jgi:guanine deaminase
MSDMQSNPLELTFLERAIDLAVANVRARGGPFGAVITRDGVIVSEGVNRVTAENDPTWHAEIAAIRGACLRLDTYILSGCRLYSSCEPCPMCLAAALWARLDFVVYCATGEDATRAGFDDRVIHQEVCQSTEQIGRRFARVYLPEGDRPFQEWAVAPGRMQY